MSLYFDKYTRQNEESRFLEYMEMLTNFVNMLESKISILEYKVFDLEKEKEALRQLKQ